MIIDSHPRTSIGQDQQWCSLNVSEDHKVDFTGPDVGRVTACKLSIVTIVQIVQGAY